MRGTRLRRHAAGVRSLSARCSAFGLRARSVRRSLAALIVAGLLACAPAKGRVASSGDASVAALEEATRLSATVSAMYGRGEFAAALPIAERVLEAVKTARSPAILHIATHGSFVPPPERKGVLQEGPWSDRLTGDDNPLLRSGIVLAGANEPPRGAEEDGVLTALEASTLDLSGTELVVLSACETGVGDIRTGDGIHGLRRALTLAGARSQVMTLWSVSDDATRDLMIAFYRRLAAGEPRAEALRQAQLGFLRRPDRRHPYFWAGFILAGSRDPVPLQP